MSIDQSDESERTIARRRVQARTGLVLHAAMYAVFNAGMLAIWAISSTHYPWFLWPMFGWGIGLIGHVVGYFYGPGSPNEERAIERELYRMHENHAA